jgi:hypothetical protein
MDKKSGRRWNLYLAVQYLLAGHIGSILGLIPTLVCLNHSTIQADPGKNTLAASFMVNTLPGDGLIQFK